MTGSESVPHPQKVLRLICHGVSMSPVIRNGDEITLSRALIRDIRFGDIVTYVKNKNLVTHRFLCKHAASGGRLLVSAKGDNASNRDEPFDASALMGKVIEIRRGNQTIDVQKSPWPLIFFMTASFSFLEWKLYQAFFGKRAINPSLKKIIKPLIRGPKNLLSHLLIFITGGKSI